MPTRCPQRRRWIGYGLIGLTLAISYALWLGQLAANDGWYASGWYYPAKIASHGTLILMAWAFILATRFKPIEWLFGGLDKVYRAHRHVGEAAFFLIFLHPICLALGRSQSLGEFAAYFWFSSDAVRNTGLVALVAFVLLVVLSIYVRIAYHRWKRIHDWFGLLLVLVVIHAVISPGQIMEYPLLTIWYGIWVVLGLGAWIYIRLLYRFVGPQFDVVVADVRDVGDSITQIDLAPVGRVMRFEAGQFLYISFDADAVSEEPHPFSIASAPQTLPMRLAIKRLGDWTQDVARIQPGERARIWGPYGRFNELLFQQPERPVVLLGGGIGITPMLSILHSEAFAARPGTAHLIYAVPRADKRAYHEEIARRAAGLSQVSYHEHLSDEQGFIDVAYLRSIVTDPLPDHLFLVCGPGVMMQAIRDVLEEAGVAARQISMEEFSIR